MEWTKPKPKIVWVNILFMAVTGLVGLIGAPLYLFNHALPGSIIALTLFYMAATALSITVGYHRCFAHLNFKAHPILETILLFFGAAAFEQSAYRWAYQHRDHHRYVDTDRDPYSIKKGFWYAHIGWLLFWEHAFPFDNVSDLQKNPRVMNQHRYYKFWALGSGIVVPVLIGALMGHALAAFIFAVCLRVTLVYHSTFFINSFCHMIGTSTYDIDATAKDSWLIALLTFGEGYHNFHHRFPTDYRNGVRWYHWDPSKWFIKIFSWVGLATDIKKVSTFRILHARLAADHKRAGNRQINLYEDMCKRLHHWETAFNEHRTALATSLTKKSQAILQASQKLAQARSAFQRNYQQWLSITNT